MSAERSTERQASAKSVLESSVELQRIKQTLPRLPLRLLKHGRKRQMQQQQQRVIPRLSHVHIVDGVRGDFWAG